jgi:hypothetical protein
MSPRLPGLVLSLLAAAAQAENGTDDSVQALRAELERLKAAQAEGALAIQKLEDRIAALEAPATAQESLPKPPEAPAVLALNAAPQSRLDVSGDFRLRYEGNYGDDDAPDWQRGVLRARLGATYAVNERLTIGGRLSTGDPDDPNSSDVTLSNFADDFDVSLDAAYAKVAFADATLWGGKFQLPFMRTDLVWDGDVNPQGIGANYELPLGGGALKLAGLYFLVDQSVAGSDSSMLGAQLGFELPLTEDLRAELAAGWYDYALPGVAGADAGDLRSNLIGPDGRYVSDFDLVDVIASLTFRGRESWPLRLTTEYVRNLGARTSGDSGYSIELFAGKTAGKGDWRLGYGYSVAEVDAVLAAFSHDNTTIATNYRQHALVINYAITKDVILDATLYHYRPYDAEFSGVNDPEDWLDRLRLNVLVNF